MPEQKAAASRRPVGAAAVMAAAMAASIAAPVLLPAEGRAIINLPFYLMGACAGIHFDRAVRRSFPKTARAAALLLIAATAQLDLTGSLRWLQLPIQLLQILCVWIAADWLATEKAPGWYFQLSFFLYCSHNMVLESVEKIFYLLTDHGTGGALIDLLLAAPLTVLLITAAAWVLKKTPPLWRVLNGGR